MNKFSTAGNVVVDSTQMCVLYDARTGTIRHAHTVVSLGGVAARDAAAVEKETYELASRAGKDVREAKPLHLSELPSGPPSQYKVDVERGTLIALEPLREAASRPVRGDIIWRVLIVLLVLAVIWLAFR